MTFIDVFTALAVLSVFLLGFSQIFLPAYSAWEKARAEYDAARTIYFIAESFREECARQDRNIDRWKKTAASAKEMETCEITEIMRDDAVYALKAICVISGERFEIVGLCAP